MAMYLILKNDKSSLIVLSKHEEGPSPLKQIEKFPQGWRAERGQKEDWPVFDRPTNVEYTMYYVTYLDLEFIHRSILNYNLSTEAGRWKELHSFILMANTPAQEFQLRGWNDSREENSTSGNWCVECWWQGNRSPKISCSTITLEMVLGK